ncbi:ABC transporter ATP-binding protein [Marinomonas agarivorans]|nr:ABC transporter ATP-binding protein [Marinomonas agarivorans]
MALLEVKNLNVSFGAKHNAVPVLFDISFILHRRERIAIVGESGAGKSTLGFALVNLLSKPGHIHSGTVKLDGTNLTTLTSPQMQKIRGKRIAMIFQDPMVTLNPVITIGKQMVEAIRAHTSINRHDAKKIVLEKLAQVQIPAPDIRFDQYPHELSGGMRQRVIIATALLLTPDIIIADEPTTALDVTIQAEILELLKSMCEENNVALILITHDLGVVSRVAERTMVMYAGRIVEEGPTLEIINDPQHPYTQGLLNALPQMTLAGHKLNQIPGSMPSLSDRPNGCAFHPRCQYAIEKCQIKQPNYIYSGISTVACHVLEDMISETSSSDSAFLNDGKDVL